MNADELLRHYERVADAPDAVARLRRFILELAVKGKLVPQDPRDEPASELLKKIATENVGLVSGRQANASAASSNFVSSVSELPCPTGWSIASLQSLCTSITDGDHLPPPKAEAGIPFLVIGNVRGQRIDFAGCRHVAREYYERLDPIRRPRRGDLLYTLVGSYGIPVVVSDDRPFCVQRHIGILRPSKLLVLRFLARVLESQVGFNQATACATGIAQKTVSLSGLRRMAIPLPPVAEQHRIVAKVDELMALCDRLEAARAKREAARDRLARSCLARLDTPDSETFREDARFALDALPALTARLVQIKQLRQTILNLAVRGKLLPQDPCDESAGELLNRARKAKALAFGHERLRERSPISMPNRDDMAFAFPTTWALASFDDLFVIVSGVTKGQKVSASEAVDVPYLRVANVQRGHLDMSVVKSITVRAADAERYALRSGDILMTEGGDWDKLGRAAIWRNEVADCIHQNHIFRVRPGSSEVLPEWVVCYVNSPLGRAFFESAAKQTTNLASINMTQLRSCPLPLPSAAEQRRIVAKVDELMALCDRLEASLTQADEQRRRLLEALLHQALAPAATLEEQAA